MTDELGGDVTAIVPATTLAISLIIATLSYHPALADITGPAIVTDGDTIKIDGQRIRIHGIDAPDSLWQISRALQRVVSV